MYSKWKMPHTCFLENERPEYCHHIIKLLSNHSNIKRYLATDKEEIDVPEPKFSPHMYFIFTCICHSFTVAFVLVIELKKHHIKHKNFNAVFI